MSTSVWLKTLGKLLKKRGLKKHLAAKAAMWMEEQRELQEQGELGEKSEYPRKYMRAWMSLVRIGAESKLEIIYF